MTFQEALEYLNLPENSSKQLVSKRYLELKKDYQKAINNAPSEHFSSLYQENLNKIEEAYCFLTEKQEVNKSNTEIIQSIQGVQQIVDNFLQSGETPLHPEASDKIQNYIDQVNSFQDYLREEETETEPSDRSNQEEKFIASNEVKPDQKPKEANLLDHIEEASAPKTDPTKESRKSLKNLVDNDDKPETSRWRWEPKSPKDKPSSLQDKAKSPAIKKPSGLINSESVWIEKWIIDMALNRSFAATPGTRKQSFNQLITIVILAIIMLCVFGAIYILFPLL